MYKVGDVVVYGTEGICKIKDIKDRKFAGNSVKYYILCPLKKTGETVYVPCKNEKIMERMRAVLTREEADALLDRISAIHLDWIENERERQKEYKDILLHGTSEDVMAMTRNLHLHREKQVEKGKKLHASDEKFLKDAEKMILEELAYAFKLTVPEVLELVVERKSEN